MKILFLSNFIYEPNAAVFQKNACGFGMMVSDILKAVSETQEVYLLTRAISGEMTLSGYSIVPHRKRDILMHTTFEGLCKGIKAFFQCKQKLNMKLRYLYYVIDMGVVRKVIKELKPDIVHVHGLSFSTKQYIDLLRELGLPFVVTLHGLIGLDQSVVASQFDIDYEKEFLRLSESEEIPVTVISSGIKQRIQHFYGITGKNVHVVLNGISVYRKVHTEHELRSFRNKIGIQENTQVVISVGNITKNKNQKQVLEALQFISSSIRDNIKVIFAGKDVLGGELQRLAEHLDLQDIVVFPGFLERCELAKLYDIADLNVFSSLNDGFGLPIVEGFLYGVPVVTFDDLDAFRDIYDPNAVLVAQNRETAKLAQAIESGLNRQWDKDMIEAVAQRFSVHNMAQQYISIYSAAMNGNRSRAKI